MVGVVSHAAGHDKKVIAFHVAADDPQLKFLRAIEDFVSGKAKHNCDVILAAARIALDNPEYEFEDSRERGRWKALAFPILYADRSDLSNWHGTVTGRLSSAQPRWQFKLPKTKAEQEVSWMQRAIPRIKKRIRQQRG